jgi:hypothetical protein
MTLAMAQDALKLSFALDMAGKELVRSVSSRHDKYMIFGS